ncbi:MAG: hypothetical protein CVU48_09025 [Candidatus Cloacimonetes bacterium HGW-Cloacimonetes-1]|jgi:hypothetical protein|nr:MAG: hypothetical protein CVU48_09025 [Candidatus Cloacimonetes bacterium HGW-Cloacimonetes-1]
MKTTVLKAILLCVVIVLVLGGCKKDDTRIFPTDVTRDDADWEILIFDMNTPACATTMVYQIDAWFIGHTADFNSNDDLVMTINDTLNITLPYIPTFGAFVNETALEPGTVYKLKFSLNGVEKTNVSLRMPYRATYVLPQVLYHTGENNVTWTLEQNNQYQYVVASAYNSYDTGINNTIIRYAKPSARELRFRGDELVRYGQSTLYGLFAYQAQFQLKNRIALCSLNFSHAYYNNEQKGEVLPTPLETARKIMRLIRLQQ